ncbi:class I adenylate-forming enzyme family protein [Streptomyces sp. NPDC020731]|uniref:class I adenylate-forming enzyme family protein n=1 Tax=Streptomyces sp. NPDC020731 TaxID=3365085 RepID=UPI0037A0DDF1
MSYAPEPSPAAGPAFLHDLLDAAAHRWPRANALADTAGRWTYAQLREAGLRAAAWLRDRGIRRGDRVLTQLPNCRELAALLYGTSRLGAVLVPVNPQMKPFHLTTVLRDADPALVIGDARTAGALREVTPAPVVELDEARQEIRAAAPVVGRAASVTGHDAALLIYTSGSTSAPKAVVCPHRQILFAVRAIDQVLRYRPDDVVFLRLPMSFDYGLHQLFLAALNGAAVHLAEEGHDLTLLRRIRATGATVVPLVPSLAQLLTHLAGRDPAATRVRLFTNTGAALTEALCRDLRAGFPGARIALMFGTTECKRVSVLEPDGDLAKPGSVGPPIPGTAVEVTGEDGTPLPPGAHGEFVVRGPHVMSGYWGAPELTAHRFRRDERTGEVVLHTGDFGHMDEDGHLYFSGRRDDIVKHRGTRVSLLEIEAAALDVPGVRAAAAVSLHDPAALVLCAVADLPSTEPLVQGLVERLEAAKLPDRCVLLERLPLTPNQKTDRRGLAEIVRKQQ